MRKLKLSTIIKKIDRKYLIIAILLIVAGGAVAFKESREKRAPVWCALPPGGVTFFQVNFTLDPNGPLRGYCSNAPGVIVNNLVRMR